MAESNVRGICDKYRRRTLMEVGVMIRAIRKGEGGLPSVQPTPDRHNPDVDK
jgi:hypothetical protein